LKKGKNCTFSYNVTDAENDSLTYDFQLMPESRDKKASGDFEKIPEPISLKLLKI
jgi:hypothetical protein